MELIEFSCGLCGKRGSVEFERTGDFNFDAPLRRLAAHLTHNACADKRLAKLDADKRLADEVIRMKSWDKLCPDEFRKPISWGKKKEAEQRRKLYSAVMAWDYGSGPGLYIWGRPGTCKTRFSWQLLGREFRAGRRIMALSHSEFRQRVTALMRDSQAEAVVWLAFLARAEILFLDDFGKGNTTPASEEAIHDLLDKRYRDGRRTIFTSERSIQAACGAFTVERRDAIARRISETTEEIAI